MADKKISALTAASTPLAGTEVLPIVQSGATVKVATNDLTVKNIRSNATTGLLQVAGPGTGTTRVVTVPDANFTAARTDAAQSFTGAQTFNGNIINGATTAPAFSAISAASQNPTSAVLTKVIFGTEIFDTNSNFASSTFTPTVAGYYQLNASASMGADGASTAFQIAIYRNGSSPGAGSANVTGVSTLGYYVLGTSAVMYFNGTTDYAEVYAQVTGAGALRYIFFNQAGLGTCFNGSFVRSA